jgi:hypothetical protein
VSYTLLGRHERTARKQHRCIWCGEAIDTGSVYVDEASVFDGSWQAHKWHPECEDDARTCFQYDDTFAPYAQDRPKEVAP